MILYYTNKGQFVRAKVLEQSAKDLRPWQRSWVAIGSTTISSPKNPSSKLVLWYNPPVLTLQAWYIIEIMTIELPSGKHTKNDDTSPFSMGKSTVSMAIFNSFLYVYQRVNMADIVMVNIWLLYGSWWFMGIYGYPPIFGSSPGPIVFFHPKTRPARASPAPWSSPPSMRRGEWKNADHGICWELPHF